VTVVGASGELDATTAPQLRLLLLDLLEDSQRNVVVDLSAVTFLDSTGLGVLVGGTRRLTDAGGTFSLVVTDARILQVLHLTGLQRVLTVFTSRAEAVAQSA
jgi:anti-sigma B factor antagonist